MSGFLSRHLWLLNQFPLYFLQVYFFSARSAEKREDLSVSVRACACPALASLSDGGSAAEIISQRSLCAL